MEEQIRNRVDESGLVSLDLADLLPKSSVVSFDLQDHLWEGFILREKPFREMLKSLSESDFSGRTVALYCSTDAVIPDWAWMLVTSELILLKAHVLIGNPEQVRSQQLIANIDSMDPTPFVGARIVIKGCSEAGGPHALGQAIRKLQPIARSIMYGEPCSTVPIYKLPKASS
ncbi:MAG: DUF2480 family protein [Flavobacteriales bacterium]|nr:DUF2480 family protein [Flavobacteriales bacterium]